MSRIIFPLPSVAVHFDTGVSSARPKVRRLSDGFGRVCSKTRAFYGLIYRLNTTERVAALTFDDGPNGEYTARALRILKKEGIKGTFFLIGKNVETYPELVKEIARELHCIGNHSYTHSWLLPFKTDKALADEIYKTELAIYEAAGQRPRLFRPPHGLGTRHMLRKIQSMGYKMIMWDNMTTDYLPKKTAEVISRKIVMRSRPGTIIVLHDGLNLNHMTDRGGSIESLKVIIRRLRERGYRFVSLTEGVLKTYFHQGSEGTKIKEKQPIRLRAHD